jgi:hypothetical protein
MTDRPVGRCIGCFHDFAVGPCGGCGALPGPDDLPTTGRVPLMGDPPICGSVMHVIDRAALATFTCTQDSGHDDDHGRDVRWPRLDQEFGEPLLGRSRVQA